VRARSWLYVPAHDPRKIAKARGSDADVVILDLEDATPRDRKEAARELVRDALRGEDFGRSRRYVRVNAVDTPLWRDDVETAAAAGADGVVLPKASSAAAVRTVADALRAAGAAIPVVPIATEDVAGVFALGETVCADELVETVMWGSEDLSASLGAWRVRDEDGSFLEVFRHVRSQVLLEAARHGRRAVDTPYLAIRDLDGLRHDARRSAWQGFAGMQAIHPDHVPVLNEEFVPGDEEVRAARELVAAFESGSAVVAIDGTMADNPHLLRARKVLALVDDE